MKLRLRRYQSIPMNSAEEAQVVPIVGDAAIATVGVGHGRLIPLIIIDTTNRPDLAEVIRAQAHLPEAMSLYNGAYCPNGTITLHLFSSFSVQPSARLLSSSKSPNKASLSSTSFNQTRFTSRPEKLATASNMMSIGPKC